MKSVLKNVADFLETRRALQSRGPIVEAIFYRMKENEAEAALFEEEWAHRVDRAYATVTISESFARTGSGDVVIPPRTKTCSQLWERLTVYWTGEVVPCTADINGRRVVGNLRSQSIKEVWNSDELLSMRNLHRERKFHEIELCARCDF